MVQPGPLHVPQRGPLVPVRVELEHLRAGPAPVHLIVTVLVEAGGHPEDGGPPAVGVQGVDPDHGGRRGPLQLGPLEGGEVEPVPVPDEDARLAAAAPDGAVADVAGERRGVPVAGEGPRLQVQLEGVGTQGEEAVRLLHHAAHPVVLRVHAIGNVVVERPEITKLAIDNLKDQRSRIIISLICYARKFKSPVGITSTVVLNRLTLICIQGLGLS